MANKHEHREALVTDLVSAARRWVRYGADDKPLADAVMALDRFERESRSR